MRSRGRRGDKFLQSILLLISGAARLALGVVVRSVVSLKSVRSKGW